jgi:hypothetical protein
MTTSAKSAEVDARALGILASANYTADMALEMAEQVPV